MDVSVIIPVKNGEKFLEETLDSILKQSAIEKSLKIEICIYDDGSDDRTYDICQKYSERSDIPFVIERGETSKGVGFAKNQAIFLSTGKYLCFNDADDISGVERISEQFALAEKLNTDFIFIGCNFDRLPEDSTKRYTSWANSIQSNDEIKNQVYTSHGPTIVAPTWFISRKLFNFVGKFQDIQKTGYPEDLEFYYRCLDIASCEFSKVPKSLVTYRYHMECASFGVHENSIWNLRFSRLREKYLKKWESFTIWSVGKQGKRFFKCLNEEEKSKVRGFCDIDNNKIKRGIHEEFDEKTRKITHRIPINHIRDAIPPFVVCVKLDLTGGDLENIIAEQKWKENIDLVYFG
ncbi:unnamed protein product [Caenorhabditis angaria]|uniref:Glycosyltransferase 2-like domain-containing protein n=1 Tax=Caenorhabditis angaria TaxID=860376 RepID=A0A9P1MSW6_9PELO|nr:unnamed protein product [Caenorhabditis angaria]